MLKNKSTNKKRGFTLIELLASIGLFAVVLTIALGALLTISDSNKKARTLMSVMNNLNFAVDSMTRSFKTGEIGNKNSVISNQGGINGTHCFETTEPTGTPVKYCWDKREKSLTKDGVSLTSPDIEIQYAKFDMFGGAKKEQPLLIIVLEGEVKITDKINSKFTIHTSVAQRNLNL